jgi:two-component system sensor histidine kinase TctE
MPSIRRRLILWLLPLLIGVMGAATLFEYLAAGRVIRAGFDQNLVQFARALAARVEPMPSGLPRLQIDADALLSWLGAGSERRTFLIITADGGFVAGDRDLSITSTSNDPASVFRDVAYGAKTLREAIVRGGIDGHEVIIATASTTVARDAALHDLLRAMLASQGIQLVLLLAVVWMGVRFGLGHLNRLGEQVAARAPDDLDRLDEHAAPAEARPLLRSLNHAIARADAAIEARRDFVADAAHQLRRPLTSVLAGLELLAAELAGSPQRARAEALLADSRRLAHTTHQLLALAQTDALAAAAPRWVPVDLSALVAEVAESHLDQALARGIDLGVEISPATLPGVPWLLREALVNLVDNALRYCPAGSAVTLRCGSMAGTAFLEVVDDGPGIAPAERERVRERFHRGRHPEADGTGLGLALVEQAARVHAGTFTIDAGADGRGLCCRLALASERRPTAVATGAEQ